jgi:hypothetical protein
MEAHGIASFGCGNTWTNWIFWNRIKITQHFPDVENIRPHRRWKHSFALNDTLAATMPRNPKKRRFEAQRRHTTLLSTSHYDPGAYSLAALEDTAKATEKQRERVRLAEADA